MTNVSCAVDESYNLAGEIDTTMKIAQNYELPLGDFEDLTIDNVVTETAREILSEYPDGYVVDIPEDFDISDLSFAVASIHGIGSMSLERVKVDVLKFHITVTSTLPIDFELEADAIDASGEIAGKVEVDTRAHLSRADLDHPEDTDMEITVRTESGKIDFDGFDIILKVKSLPENGTRIYKEQGMNLKSGFLSFPEGVIVEGI